MAARALGGAKRPMPRNNAVGANELTREAERGTTSSGGESSRKANAVAQPSFAPLFFRLPLHRRCLRVLELEPVRA